jgi:superfamily I DNA/RNA helicase
MSGAGAARARAVRHQPARRSHVIDWILADEARVEVQRALRECGQPSSGEVQSALSLAKNELLSPQIVRSRSRYQAAEVIVAVWVESERELRSSNALDFDDLLAFGVRLLREHPHRLR